MRNGESDSSEAILRMHPAFLVPTFTALFGRTPILIDCRTFQALCPRFYTGSFRRLTTGLSLLVLLCLSLPASAARLRSHSPRMHMEMTLLEPGVMPEPDAELPSEGRSYSLRMAAEHTGESIDIVYRIGDTYIPDALDQLNHFLRDHRTDEVTQYDPREFDLLHNLMARLGRPNGVVDVVCGYRTAETNELLRDEGPHTGVAEHSQHIEGHAIDIRVPGVSTAQLRNAALSLDAGGVGYYPRSKFVHVDVGPVREWSFGVMPRRHGRHRRKLRA